MNLCRKSYSYSQRMRLISFYFAYTYHTILKVYFVISTQESSAFLLCRGALTEHPPVRQFTCSIQLSSQYTMGVCNINKICAYNTLKSRSQGPVLWHSTEYRFECWLFHFQSNCLLLCLGRGWKIAQARRPLPPARRCMRSPRRLDCCGLLGHEPMHRKLICADSSHLCNCLSNN